MNTTIIVRVGYYNKQNDQTRPVKFEGNQLISASNQHPDVDHANHRRYHTWTLYEVDGGFRVLDEFYTLFPGDSNHTGLSAVLTPFEVSRLYPVLANKAVDQGLWPLSEIIVEASKGEESGKPTPIVYDNEQPEEK